MTPSHTSIHSNGAAGRFSLTGPLGVSLIAIAIIGIFAIIALFTTLSAAFGLGTSDGDPNAELSKLVASNKQKMQEFQDRFNGRSVFYKPAPWPPPPAPPRAPQVPDYTPPPPQVDSGPPIKYDGPGIWYAMSDVVRFKPKTGSDKPMDVRVGEEKNGVRLISTNLPWSVRVGYKGREYDVDVWERKGDSFLLAQAPAIEIIPGLIEVPPARPKVEAPKAADGPVEAIAATPPGAAAATPQVQQPPTRDRDARAARQAPARGADRPQTQTPGESRRRGRTVTPEEDGEEDPEPNDPETEDEDAEAGGQAEGAETDDPEATEEGEAEEPPQPRRGRQPPPAPPPATPGE